MVFTKNLYIIKIVNYFLYIKQNIKIIFIKLIMDSYFFMIR